MITYYSILHFMAPEGANLPIGLVALSQPQVYFKILPQRLEQIYMQYPTQKLGIETSLEKLGLSFKPFVETQTVGGSGIDKIVREDRNEGIVAESFVRTQTKAGEFVGTQTMAVATMTDQTIIFENHEDIDFLYLLASFRSGLLQFSTLRFREGELSPALFEMCLLREL
jgi:predicted ATP-grasp superfamily ATP-dependent carboligase